MSRRGRERREAVSRSTRPAPLYRDGLPASVLVGLAEDRIAEAQLLCSAGYLSGAAYLVGYGAELLLKAVIAKRQGASRWPFEDVLDLWKTHDLNQLIVAAGLEGVMRNELRINRRLFVNWRIVRRWGVHYRYRNLRAAEASDMLRAMTEEPDGVAAWLRPWAL